jgi:hypothetical protein
VKLFRLRLKNIVSVHNCSELTPEIRQPHEPERVLDIEFSPHPKSSPAGIRNPMVLFSEVFLDQRVANRAGKRYIHNAVAMNVPNLGISELKLPATESMGMNGDSRP